MTAKPEEIVDKVRQWIAHADDDLRVAHHTLAMTEDCPYGAVAYHAQQCVEKYLKAYLVLRGVDFPYTHNIALCWNCAQRTRIGLSVSRMPRNSHLTPSRPDIRALKSPSRRQKQIRQWQSLREYVM